MRRGSLRARAPAPGSDCGVGGRGDRLWRGCGGVGAGRDPARAPVPQRPARGSGGGTSRRADGGPTPEERPGEPDYRDGRHRRGDRVHHRLELQPALSGRPVVLHPASRSGAQGHRCVGELGEPRHEVRLVDDLRLRRDARCACGRSDPHRRARPHEGLSAVQPRRPDQRPRRSEADELRRAAGNAGPVVRLVRGPADHGCPLRWACRNHHDRADQAPAAEASCEGSYCSSHDVTDRACRSLGACWRHLAGAGASRAGAARRRAVGRGHRARRGTRPVRRAG